MLIFLLMFLFSCDLTGKDTGANDGLHGDFVDSSQLLLADGTLEGSGQIVASRSLGQVRGARSFHLRFNLPNEGSMVKLTAYGTRELRSGVALEFIRLNGQLEVTISGGGTEITIVDRFDHIDPTRTLDFMIDVHNDHDDASHLLVWPYLGDSATSYGPQNSIVNSDFFKLPIILDGYDFPDWHDFSVKGNGAFWGLDLLDAKVMIYRVAPPKDNS